MAKPKVTGHWIVFDYATKAEVHRIECHYPKDSSQFRKAEDGLDRKVDYERFYVVWEDA